MSPKICIVSFMEPIQAPPPASGEGGTTSATGFPKRVIRSGFLVCRTRSSRARHFALNSEMATSSMGNPSDYYNLPWLEIMVIINRTNVTVSILPSEANKSFVTNVRSDEDTEDPAELNGFVAVSRSDLQWGRHLAGC